MVQPAMSEPEQELRVRAIDTAYGWSASSGDGLTLYALASCRRVASEAERTVVLGEIDRAMAWNEALPQGWTDPHGVNVPSRDMPLLRELREVVEQAEVGVEWFSHAEYCARADALEGQGRLREAAQGVGP